MNKKRLLYVLVLLMLLVAMPTGIHAQEEFPDGDGDAIPDDYDGCPTESGLPENAGCPAGVTPPDSDADGQPDVYDNCPAEPGAAEMGGCPDGDGDFVPDPFDPCPTELGLTQNSGCPLGVVPDLDGDGLSDRDDFCYDRPGDAGLGGCPAEAVADFDSDGVIDAYDACYDEIGVADNFGCPAGVTADSDFDGVPDSSDSCVRQPGTPENGGCPLDSDGDFIEDRYDGCPTGAGDGRNNGCPAGESAPDSDGDAAPDIFDRCPNEAGLNGYDCPDTDGDFVPDIDDLCPAETGDPGLSGCVAVDRVTLPGNRVALSAGNINGITRLGNLRVTVSEVKVADNNLMVVQTWSSGILLYNLADATLTPSPLESQGGLIAVSANGAIVTDTLFDPQLNVPAITVWDPAARNGLHYIPINEETTLNTVAVNADGTQFVTTHGFISFFGEPMPEGDNFVRLWDVASGTQINAFNHPSGVTQAAFSPDGSKLATGTDAGIFLWDIASGSQLAQLDAKAVFTSGNALVFSPDGSKLAVGEPEGVVSVWDMNSFTELYQVQAVVDAQYGAAVMGIDFNPDGSLLAASGGPFVDGPPLPDFNFQIVILDANSGSRVGGVEHLTSIPRTVGFSPDGTMLIFNDATSVEFYGITQ